MIERPCSCHEGVVVREIFMFRLDGRPITREASYFILDVCERCGGLGLIRWLDGHPKLRRPRQ